MPPASWSYLRATAFEPALARAKVADSEPEWDFSPVLTSEKVTELRSEMVWLCALVADLEVRQMQRR